MSREVIGEDGTVYEFPDAATPDEVAIWTAPRPQASGPGMMENAMGFLPAAGGLAGGMIGGAGGTIGGFGVGGIPGAIGGAALGTAGGEAIRQHLARALGLNAPESAGEAAGRIGLAGAGGAAGAALPLGAVKALGSAGRAVAQKVPGGIGGLAQLPGLRKLRGVQEWTSAIEDVGGALRKPAAPSKVAGSIKPAPKPKAPAKPKPAAKAAPAEERVPIKVIGDKGKVQNATRGKSQRGATQRQLAARKPRAAPEPLDAASRLELSLEFEKEMARRGFSQQQRQALRRGAMEYLQQGGAQ